VSVLQKITINSDQGEILRAISPEGELAIEGTLHFQACDDTVCYAPQKVPLEWKIKILMPAAQSRLDPEISAKGSLVKE
jgi:hypothetical protein